MRRTPATALSLRATGQHGWGWGLLLKTLAQQLPGAAVKLGSTLHVHILPGPPNTAGAQPVGQLATPSVAGGTRFMALSTDSCQTQNRQKQEMAPTRRREWSELASTRAPATDQTGEGCPRAPWGFLSPQRPIRISPIDAVELSRTVMKTAQERRRPSWRPPAACACPNPRRKPARLWPV